MKSKLLAMLIFSCFIAPINFAQDDGEPDEAGVSITADISFLNKYVWHGITYTDGLAIQPCIMQEFGPWSVQIWGSFVGSDKNEITDSEIDLYLNYNLELGGLVITPSVFLYNYPKTETPSTAELSLALSYSIGSFSLESTFCTDVLEAKGYLFATHNISFEKEFFSRLTVYATMGIGWGTSKFYEYYLGLSKSTLGYYYGGLSMNYSLTDQICISPSVEVYLNADKEFEDLVGSNTVNYGVTFSYSF